MSSHGPKTSFVGLYEIIISEFNYRVVVEIFPSQKHACFSVSSLDLFLKSK